MAENIEILFDPPNGVYYSGQMVSGTVKITLVKPKKFKGILLTIRGSGKVEWYEETKNKKKKRGKPDYTASEDYLTMNTHFMKSDNDNSIELPVGVSSYIFKYHLPDDLPTSFEGTRGHIRFTAKVSIERPWKSIQTYTAGFTVIRMVDLNREYPQSKLPIEMENIRSYGCWVCKTYPLILKASIPKSGFVPGEMIPIKINMHSVGSIQVTEIRVYLRKIVSYRADKPIFSFHEECINVLHKTCGNLQAASSTEFEEKLVVPAIPPTTKLHSKIIQINYDVKIEAVLGMRDENPSVLFPITIGTAPLLPDNPRVLNLSNALGSTSLTPSQATLQGNVEASDGSVMINGVLPPTYEESVEQKRVKLGENEEHAIESSEYSPRYPVYNFEFPSPVQRLEECVPVQAERQFLKE